MQKTILLPEIVFFPGNIYPKISCRFLWQPHSPYSSKNFPVNWSGGLWGTFCQTFCAVPACFRAHLHHNHVLKIEMLWPILEELHCLQAEIEERCMQALYITFYIDSMQKLQVLDSFKVSRQFYHLLVLILIPVIMLSGLGWIILVILAKNYLFI